MSDSGKYNVFGPAVTVLQTVDILGAITLEPEPCNLLCICIPMCLHVSLGAQESCAQSERTAPESAASHLLRAIAITLAFRLLSY